MKSLSGTDENSDTVNWLKIKVLQFEKNCNYVLHKYRYADQFRINVHGGGRPVYEFQLPQLVQCLKCRLLMSQAKKVDLLALCKSAIIPKKHLCQESTNNQQKVKPPTIPVQNEIS